MIKCISTFIMLTIVLGGQLKYSDDKIESLLQVYYKSKTNAPILLGQQFYTDRDDHIFQIEIEVELDQVHEGLLFGFESMMKIVPHTKRNIDYGMVIIHFRNNHLPVVEICDIACSEKFFLDKTINEAAWRKHCLIIEDKDG